MWGGEDAVCVERNLFESAQTIGFSKTGAPILDLPVCAIKTRRSGFAHVGVCWNDPRTSAVTIAVPLFDPRNIGGLTAEELVRAADGVREDLRPCF